MKRLRLVYPLLILFIADCSNLQAQIISTIAGNGSQGYSGDGGPAIMSTNFGPWGTVVDKKGNVYFADPGNNVIRKVDVNGIITKWAGSGTGGYSGDGGLAKDAELLGPSHLVSDDIGNIYFADDQETRVRKIDTNGIITTIAGNGLLGYSGDGGPAIAASFNLIFGVTPDHNGNIYIADYQNHVIRKIDASGIVSTIAGTGNEGFSGDNGPAVSAQLSYPTEVGVDGMGNIYIPDQFNRRIRKIDNAGIITTIAGDGTFGYSGDGGPAVAARIGVVYQVKVDAAGQIFIPDEGSNVVRKIDCSGIITTYAGTGIAGFSGDGGPAGIAKLSNPINIGTDVTGDIYITDQYNFRVRKVTNIPVSINNTQPSRNNICQGLNAVFTCNFPSSAIFQWQVLEGDQWIGLTDNALYAGSSTSVLTAIKPPTAFNGNQYRCVIASTCDFYISNTDTLFVSGGLGSVTISTPSDSICRGTTAVFSIAVQNIQPDMMYDWKLNGNSTGMNTPFYSTDSISNNDYINCTVTDNSSCTAVDTIESNVIRMQVTDSLEAAITITSSENQVCSGTPVHFFASSTNQGSNPAYQWQINGSGIGNSLPDFQSGTLADGDVVSCLLTSSLACAAPVQSTGITMIVHSSPQVDAGNDTVIIPGKSVQLNPVVTGNIITYTWSPSTGLDDPNEPGALASPTISTTYHLTVSDNNGCTASDSLKIWVYSKLKMPNAFSPDGNGVNDIFRIPPGIPLTIKRFTIYDRWGMKVFETADAGKGWDGKFNNVLQVTGTYVWVIQYIDPVSHHEMKDSGTVILIR